MTLWLVGMELIQNQPDEHDKMGDSAIVLEPNRCVRGSVQSK